MQGRIRDSSAIPRFAMDAQRIYRAGSDTKFERDPSGRDGRETNFVSDRVDPPASIPPMWQFIIAMVALALGLPLEALAERDASPPPARQQELLRLLHQDCGACHGMRLNGGLGPALTASALKDRPDASLVATIVAGRRGTPMPPWQPFMTDEEARWLVARLKEGDTDGK